MTNCNRGRKLFNQSEVKVAYLFSYQQGNEFTQVKTALMKLDAFLTTLIKENSYEIVLLPHRFSCVVPSLLAFFEDRKVITQLVKSTCLILYSWWWEG